MTTPIREAISDLIIREEWFACDEHGSVICECALADRDKALDQLETLLTKHTERAVLTELEEALMVITSDDTASETIKARINRLKTQLEAKDE